MNLPDDFRWSIEFGVPVKPVGTKNRREHWRVRAKRVKSERACGYAALREACENPWSIPRLAGGATIHITRIAQKHRQCDDDNMIATLCAVRDGLADAMKIQDNDPRVSWEYGQETGAYGVRVWVGERQSTNPDGTPLALPETWGRMAMDTPGDHA